MRAAAWLAAIGLGTVACGDQPGAPREALVEIGASGDLAKVEWSSREVVRLARRYPDRIELAVDAARLGADLVVSAPGRCSVAIAAKELASGARRRIELRPWLAANAGDQAQVGFDAPFTITLTPGCREALAGRAEWKQTAGPKLETTTTGNGLVLRGRTRPFRELAPGPLPWGVVPFSPRTRGEYAFEATWTGGGRTERIEVRIASTARAAGLPSVAVGQVLHLGGAGWSVKAPARNGTARVVDRDGLSTFQPDVRGRWLLVDGAGRELGVVAGTHAETPLDCGRSDCHAKETDAVQSSKMTSVLSRAVARTLVGLPNDCAIGCHAAGEPGLADGGFTQIRAELGLDGVWPGAAQGWDGLPRPLRRLGGVTCTACHGPGAIPEQSARWAVLRSDVCAVCHDAPPRYEHMLAWGKTRMARADHDQDAARLAECRPCHTTAGFLASQGIRKDLGDVPAGLELGIACAACHAPHGKHVGVALVRDVPTPKALPELPASALQSKVCLPCHSAMGSGNALGRVAGGTAARILLGSKTPAHAAVPGGCMGCHGRPPAPPGERGAGHDFRALDASCTRGCHEGGMPKRDPLLRRRAVELYERLGGRLEGDRPPHAASALEVPEARASALEDVLLVLEDPAADAHDPAYAKALLDRAERALKAP